MNFRNLSILFAAMLFFACENKDLNEGESFQPREIHENIPFHFQKITVDGIEYLILEKDNNNPHEGFGFMAFRANKLVEKQDTVLAYLRTVQARQDYLISKVTGKPLSSVRDESRDLFLKYLNEEMGELNSLESNSLSNEADTSSSSSN